MRAVLCAIVFALAPVAARAHWVWIYPDCADAAKAHVVFAHHLAPDDNPKILDKIADAKLYLRTADGDKAIAWTRGDRQYTFAIPGPVATVGGVNDYGVIQKGTGKPFRLVQCPKMVLGDDARPWSRLPFEIVPSRNGKALKLTVLHQGKPAPAGLIVTVHGADDDKSTTLTTDAKGSVELTPERTGLLNFSVPYTVAEAGEIGGKKYEETRYTASLVVSNGTPKASVKGDPDAIKLFEAARMAQAHWVNFPGFTADVEVQVDGKTASGKVVVGADYKLAFTGLPKELEDEARRELSSAVGHRKDTSKEPTPAVVFDDAAGASPLGRAIRVVGDKFDSGYRIRDNQLFIVQRTMPKQRFVIVLLENAKNAEGKFLPGSHTVQYFDNETGKLVKSDANFHSWTRQGAFDLPVIIIKQTTQLDSPAAQIGPRALRVTLSNHRLSEAATTSSR